MRKLKLMKAGKFLGSGTYGCVFDPPLQCKQKRRNKTPISKPTSRYIGKVFTNLDEYEIEKRLMEMIQKDIDPENIFTVPYLEACEISKPTSDDMKDVTEDCAYLSGKQEKQIVYENGGVDLDKIAPHINTFSAFVKIIKSMSPIFQGIVILQSKGYVHNDVKPGNILYDRKSKTCKLIDFGMMEKASDLFQQEDTVKDTPYMCYPIEYKLFNSLARQRQRGSRSIQIYSADTMFAHITTSLSFMKRYGVLKAFKSFNIEPIAELEALHTFIQSKSIKPTNSNSNSPAKNNALHNIFTQWSSKIDVWAIGISILRFMMYSGFLEPQTSMNKYQLMKHQLIKNFVSHLIHPNPMFRATPQVAKERFEELIKLI